eukprot:TRINITY_DN103172_c0_g1_i1.p1 TRINITY_DN103172_c0_g1~~TRINITY_DN103172_c0_g1_i1.p1  ORF type:complete len:159 (+),score=31.22 TRINITY_DN103172_c0_g1_i1:54-530(+)
MSADNARRGGVGFDYAGDESGRGRRKRGQEEAEQQRQDKRAKRKALWGGGGETSGNSDVAKPEEAAKAGSVSSPNGWENTSLGYGQDKSKFLRLMGGGKQTSAANYGLAQGSDDKRSSAQQGAPLPRQAASAGQQRQQLEQQFWQAQRQTRGRGLGAA